MSKRVEGTFFFMVWINPKKDGFLPPLNKMSSITKIIYMLVGATILLPSCKSERDHLPNEKRFLGEDIDASKKDQVFKELQKIDLAISAWYAYQHDLGEIIEPFVKNEFNPISINKLDSNPKNILEEQLRVAVYLTDHPPSNNSELINNLKWWYAEQVEAINIIRVQLGKDKITGNKVRDIQSILHAQIEEMTELEELRKSLESEAASIGK